jgi:hypothetical protein
MKLREHLRRVAQANQVALVQIRCNHMETEYLCTFYAHHSGLFLSMIGIRIGVNVAGKQQMI